jgi:hypothetical protein
MTFYIPIRNLAGDKIANVKFNNINNNLDCINQINIALINSDFINRVGYDGNKLIVLLDGDYHFYINFLYSENNVLKLFDSPFYRNISINNFIRQGIFIIIIDFPLSIYYLLDIMYGRKTIPPKLLLNNSIVLEFFKNSYCIKSRL